MGFCVSGIVLLLPIVIQVKLYVHDYSGLGRLIGVLCEKLLFRWVFSRVLFLAYFQGVSPCDLSLMFLLSQKMRWVCGLLSPPSLLLFQFHYRP